MYTFTPLFHVKGETYVHFVQRSSVAAVFLSTVFSKPQLFLGHAPSLGQYKTLSTFTLFLKVATPTAMDEIELFFKVYVQLSRWIFLRSWESDLFGGINS